MQGVQRELLGSLCLGARRVLLPHTLGLTVGFATVLCGPSLRMSRSGERVVAASYLTEHAWASLERLCACVVPEGHVPRLAPPALEHLASVLSGFASLASIQAESTSSKDRLSELRAALSGPEVVALTTTFSSFQLEVNATIPELGKFCALVSARLCALLSQLLELTLHSR